MTTDPYLYELVRIHEPTGKRQRIRFMPSVLHRLGVTEDEWKDYPDDGQTR